MTPAFGARFELLRQAVDAQAAVYAATIYLPQATRRLTLRIARADGGVELASAAGDEAGEGELPAWVNKHLQALARQIFRGAGRDGDFLRRLMRWHEEPQITEARGQRLTGQSDGSGSGDTVEAGS
jgi:hypothetical protein